MQIDHGSDLLDEEHNWLNEMWLNKENKGE